MLRIGKAVFGTSVVYGASYGGVEHDPVAATERLLLDPAIQAVEGSWAIDASRTVALRDRIAWSGCDAIYLVGGIMRRRNIDPSVEDDAARREAVMFLKAMAETAVGLGCRMLLVCSGPDTRPDARPEAVDRLAGVLEELCAHAAALRPGDPLWITFEHFDRELDQKRLVGPTQEAVELVKRVRQKHTNIGLTLDLSHVIQLGEEIAEAVAEARDVLVHAHVANCGLNPSIPTTFGDSHCRFGAPGGAVGLEEVTTFLEALVRNGYGATPLPTALPLVSVEMKTPEGETPELAIAAGLRMLYRAASLADTRF